MIKFNKCPCLQLSDECFHTVAPHTNTSQEHKCLNHQNVSGFRKFSFIVLEHLCHLQSTLVFMQKYHYFTTQAPCSLPYLRLLWEILLRIIGGVPWALDMKMVAFTEKNSPSFILLTQAFPPQPTQFWCSSLTTVIFVATTVTTSAEEKLEIWWLFLCPNWELKAPLHSHQFALLPGCATMVEMSHTRNALVFDNRDQWTD